MLKLFFAISAALALTTCTKRNLNIECLRQKYTSSELSLFSETGFNDYKVTKRWNTNLKVTLRGQFTLNDSKNLDSLMDELNGLLYPIKVVHDNTNYNVIVHWTNSTYFPNTLHLTSGFNGLTIVRTKFPFSSQITNAEIWIDTKLTENVRRLTLRHEFFHAFGQEHAITFRNVIMGVREYRSIDDYMESGAGEIYYPMSTLDIASIKILYDSCIPMGVGYSEFRSVLEKNHLWTPQKIIAL